MWYKVMKTPTEQRFEELYETESDAVFRYCMFRISSREAALDLAQDTFMRFWDALVKGREIRNDKAFLFVIARNLVIDWYRKKKSVSLDAIVEESGDQVFRLDNSTMEDMDSSAEARFVMDKLVELEPSYQHIVYLRFVEDLKPKDIAAILGVSANAVSVRINRGLKELRRIAGYEGNRAIKGV
jgi:RNA polymerase sigma-70 factor, ECF subfamily